MELLNDPTFWVAVAFVIFVVLVFKPGRNAIGGALDEKIAQIRNEVDEAQRLREEAQASLAAYQRQQRDAAQEAEALMARAQAEIDSHRKQAAAQLKTVLERQESLARGSRRGTGSTASRGGSRGVRNGESAGRQAVRQRRRCVD